MDGNHGSIHPKASDYVSSGVPFIMANDLVDGKVNYNNCVYITEKQASGLRKGFAKPGDVLLTHKATIGRTAIVPDEYDTIVLTPQVTYYRAITGINNQYLKYYFDTNEFQQLFANWAGSGSTRAYLGITAQRKLPVVLPPIEIQNKIVNILSALDDKITLNNKINANLQQQAQAIFKSWFVDFEPFDGVQPGCWEEVPFGQLVEIGKKSFNPAKEPEILLEHYSIPAYDETKYPVFELSTNIKSNKFLVDKDCFLISKLNPTTKRVWRPYCLSNHAVCSTEFIVYRAKNRAYADFLYSVVDSEPFSSFMCSHVTGTTGSRQRTTPSETLNFPLVLPTPEAIERFTEIVNPMYAKMKECMVENQKLKQLRDSLLPKLMSGELIV